MPCTFGPQAPKVGDRATVTAANSAYNVTRVQLAVTGLDFGNADVNGPTASVTVSVPPDSYGHLTANATYTNDTGNQTSDSATVTISKP